MPELPEVETMVRGIRGAVRGRRLERCGRVRCRRRPIEVTPRPQAIRTRAVGRVVTDVVRLAKRVVFKLENGDQFVIEPRMTGLMLLADPPTREHLRYRWELADETGRRNTVWFWDRRGLGTIRLLSADQYEDLRARIGVDALKLSTENLRELCAATSRPIKLLLIDQARIAGVGNLYASEILHLAQVNPHRPAAELKPTELEAITKALRQVLRQAIRHEGSTLGDGTYRNALNQDGGYQNQHIVYAKAGEPCPRCVTSEIRRVVQGQRSTFFCPSCQR